MIERASVAIGELTEHERRQRRAKYFRRNRMKYIDNLLNELEMLNLAETPRLPSALGEAVERLIQDCDVGAVAGRRPVTIVEAMDILYDIQDSLMFNEDDGED